MATAPPVHPASLGPDHLLRQCRVQRGRSGGPGGQRRNKVDTAVRLMHEPTGLRAAATERRRQSENLRVAVSRLRLKLALEVRADRDPIAGPSDLWRSRCAAGRIACNRRHQDFPVLLAEAMDSIVACRYDHRRAAAALRISPSHLVKFLQKEPAALAKVNRQRRGLGMRALR